ncbi:MAG: hypothetical protein E2586_06990 [Novosphingobium sp.]|nr:hypothetical protein [Novosphingobium sp.]
MRPPWPRTSASSPKPCAISPATACPPPPMPAPMPPPRASRGTSRPATGGSPSAGSSITAWPKPSPDGSPRTPDSLAAAAVTRDRLPFLQGDSPSPTLACHTAVRDTWMQSAPAGLRKTGPEPRFRGPFSAHSRPLLQLRTIISKNCPTSPLRGLFTVAMSV